MTESTKISFVARRVCEIQDLADLVKVLFPSNPNLQRAGARILLALKESPPFSSWSRLEREQQLSRRTIQRARAKLARLGLIEYASRLSARYGGQEGWRLSSRMSTALRQFADRIDQWRLDNRPERLAKDQALANLP